jgi:hypothetical protein
MGRCGFGTNNLNYPGTSGTMYPFFGNPYEKIVQKKDPGNDPQCAGSAETRIGYSRTQFTDRLKNHPQVHEREHFAQVHDIRNSRDKMEQDNQGQKSKFCPEEVALTGKRSLVLIDLP